MKVYKFYIKENMLKEDEVYPAINGEYKISKDSNLSLYAYTSSKGIAKYFASTRNMKLFEMMVTKMNGKEFDEFQDRFPMALLYNARFQTGRPLSDSEYDANEIIDINLITTVKEHEYITNEGPLHIDGYMDTITDCMKIVGSDPDEMIDSFMNIFNDDVKEALELLYFKEFISEHLYAEVDYSVWGRSILISSIDSLELYLHLFENTYGR